MQAQISEAVLKVAVHFKVIKTNNGRLLKIFIQHIFLSTHFAVVVL